MLQPVVDCVGCLLVILCSEEFGGSDGHSLDSMPLEPLMRCTCVFLQKMLYSLFFLTCDDGMLSVVLVVFYGGTGAFQKSWVAYNLERRDCVMILALSSPLVFVHAASDWHSGVHVQPSHEVRQENPLNLSI